MLEIGDSIVLTREAKDGLVVSFHRDGKCVDYQTKLDDLEAIGYVSQIYFFDAPLVFEKPHAKSLEIVKAPQGQKGEHP